MSGSSERYTQGESEHMVQAISTRTVEKDAGFLLPHLQTGMRILDCGCGPGTITVGLAGALDKGSVVGIDLSEGQMEAASDHAATMGLTNVQFQVGNVYVNRNMVGAVVGVQPFGGCRLSGTGPKSGGPHYLLRFATEQTYTVNTAAVGGNATLLALSS